MTADGRKITVLCSGGLKSAALELGQRFEATGGGKLAMSFGPANLLKERVERGEPFDVAILTQPLIDALIASGKLADGSAAPVARAGAGLAVRSGAPKPDIGSVGAFKRALLAAQSIAFTTSGQSGLHFARVIEGLGIAAEVRAKGKVIPGGSTGDLVAGGEAEMAVQLIPELMAVPGIEIIGPFPREVQTDVVLTAAIARGCEDEAAARAVIAYLTGPGAAATIRAKGLEPA